MYYRKQLLQVYVIVFGLQYFDLDLSAHQFLFRIVWLRI